MNYLEMLFGRVTGVYRVTAGHPLTAAAPVGATVLQVADTADFDETGGQVLIGSVVYDYTEVDPEANTLTLATALTVAPAADDQVEVFDPRVGGTTVVGYEADVVLDDQDVTDRPIQVDVPHGLVQMLEESTRGGAAEAVTLVRDGEHDWTIWQVNGKLAVDIALEEVKADLGGSLQDAYDRADEAAAAAAEAAATGTAAMTTANGKNKVTYSASAPGTTPNNPGDIWYVRSGSTITAQYEGLGGTSWASRTLTNVVVTSLDAGALTAGSAFTNALSVKTNFTLGDATTNGVIQSYNFANSSVGVFIDKNGLVAKGGSIAGAAITGGSLSTAGASYTVTVKDGFIEYAGGAKITGGGTYALYVDGAGHALAMSILGVEILGPQGLTVSQINPRNDRLTLGGDLSLPNGGITLSGVEGIAMGGNNISGANNITATGTAHLSDIFSDRHDGGGTTTASIGGQGRLLRTGESSRAVKENVEGLTLEGAKKVLELNEAEFNYIDRETYGDGRYLGVFLEDAVGLGLEQLVNRDGDDVPRQFRYEHLTVPHNAMIRDLYAVVAEQSQQIANLTARIEQMETRS